MSRSEECSRPNRRDAIPALRVPSKLPFVVGGIMVAIYTLSVLYKPSRHTADENVPKLPMKKVGCPQYADLNVPDAFAAIRKWKQRALAAEARLEPSQTAKDNADGSSSEPCDNASIASDLLNATTISALNDLLLEKWREYDDPMARWMNTATVFNDVWDKHLRRLNLLSIANHDENKYFVDFVRPPKDCSIVTLGVGYDNVAESKFLRRYPKCRLLAADPQAERNQALVEGLHGQFVNVAVAGTAGMYTAGVAGIGAKNINHMSFVDFMRRYNGDRVVDWLNMDIEKAEFGILQTMHENTTLLPPICQFNVEVHYPPDREPVESRTFVDLLEKIVRKGHYVPMHVELPNDHIVNDLRIRFLRMFFFNVRDNACVRKFVC